MTEDRSSIRTDSTKVEHCRILDLKQPCVARFVGKHSIQDHGTLSTNVTKVWKQFSYGKICTLDIVDVMV